MSEKESVDSATAQSFAERLLTILNDGALCLMISVGHRTGSIALPGGRCPAGRAAGATALALRGVRR